MLARAFLALTTRKMQRLEVVKQSSSRSTIQDEYGHVVFTMVTRGSLMKSVTLAKIYRGYEAHGNLAAELIDKKATFYRPGQQPEVMTHYNTLFSNSTSSRYAGSLDLYNYDYGVLT